MPKSRAAPFNDYFLRQLECYMVTDAILILAKQKGNAFKEFNEMFCESAFLHQDGDMK